MSTKFKKYQLSGGPHVGEYVRFLTGDRPGRIVVMKAGTRSVYVFRDGRFAYSPEASLALKDTLKSAI